MDAAHKEVVLTLMFFYKSKKDQGSIIIGRLLGNWLSTESIRDLDLYGEIRYRGDFDEDVFREAVIIAESLIADSLENIDRFPSYLLNLSRDPRSRGMPD